MEELRVHPRSAAHDQDRLAVESRAEGSNCSSELLPEKPRVEWRGSVRAGDLEFGRHLPVEMRSLTFLV